MTEVDHYKDQHWNSHPTVLRYLQRRSTGDPDLWWMDHFKREYAATPFKRGLVLACGNGWVERSLLDRGVAEHFDAFDFAEHYLEEARTLGEGYPIRYFTASFDDLELEPRSYDLIVNVAALHHAAHLYRTAQVVSRALTDDGILVNWDYTGPSRNQYSGAHLAAMSAANQRLAPRFRTPHPLLADLPTMLATDPSEAVHSADIRRALRDHFTILEDAELGGGIAYQLLWNNLDEIGAGDDEAVAALDELLRADEAASGTPEVPNLFSYVIGRPKRRTGLGGLARRYGLEPAREAFARRAGGYYPRQWLRAWVARSPARVRVVRRLRGLDAGGPDGSVVGMPSDLSMRRVLGGVRRRLGRAPGAVADQREAGSAEALLDELGLTPAVLEDRDAWSRFLRWSPPGHFYSPIPNMTEVAADRERIFPRPREVPGVAHDEDAVRDRFVRLAGILQDWSFPETLEPPRRYYTGEGNFAYGIGDGMMLHAMLRDLRPARLIEVGSGFSSCMTLDTNEFFLDSSIKLTFVEPYPELLLKLLAEAGSTQVDLREERLQDVPTEVFAELGANDVLFVDSTHVAKVGSDVVDLFGRVLPALAPGVVIHIHDVFWPLEYPESWVEQGRAWSELYVLKSFLQYNDQFEILLCNDWLGLFERPLLEQHLPRMLESPGGALWLRRR